MKPILMHAMTALVASVVCVGQIYAEEVWINGFKYRLGYSYLGAMDAQIVEASEENMQAESWNIPATVEYQDKNYKVKSISDLLNVPSVKTINSTTFYYDTHFTDIFPNLENYNISDTSSYYYSKNGIVYYSYASIQTPLPDALIYLPPANYIETLRIDGNVENGALDGNKFVKKIIIGEKGCINDMRSHKFPELEGFELEGVSNETMRIYDGALYTAFVNSTLGREVLKFIGFPIKDNNVCRIHEYTSSLAKSAIFPDVKTVIVDSPDVVLTGGPLGDNIENLIFTKPASSPKSWKLYNLAPYQLRPTVSIMGKNLRHVELPDNVKFNPYVFSSFEFEYSTNNDTKRYYRVKFCPNLEYVKGGSIAYAYSPYDNDIRISYPIISGGWIGSDFYVLPSESSTFENGFVEPVRPIEIHVKDLTEAPTASGVKYTDLNNLPPAFRIYYDMKLITFPAMLSRCAAGLNYEVGSYVPSFKEFSRLKELNLYFSDNASGLGTGLLSTLFKGGTNPGFVDINQYAEGGAVTAGRIPSALSKIGLYGNISAIPYGYFSNLTNLECLSLSENVASLGDRALYGCSSLKEFNVYAAYPPATYPETFTGVRKALVNLAVPGEALNLYRSDEGWKDFFYTDNSAAYLSIRKSIERGGDITVDFDGKLGSEAQISVTPADGYRFVCWLDNNGFYLSQSPELTTTVSLPTMLTAVFMPDEETSDLTFTTENNGTVHISFSPVQGASKYRASAYTGGLGGALVTSGETAADAQTKVHANAAANTEITLTGLSMDRTYSILVEALDASGRCLEAKWRKLNMSESAIESVISSNLSFSLFNNTLIFNGDASRAEVYSLKGLTVFSGSVTLGSAVTLAPGIYVVLVDGIPSKILVK